MAEVEAPIPASTTCASAVPSVNSDASVDKDALITRLDTLLEQYLNTLDEYERLVQQLAKQLSSVSPFRLHALTFLTYGCRVTFPSPKQTSTTGRAFTTVKTVTMNGSRRQRRCM
jgi:hypothetical protein